MISRPGIAYVRCTGPKDQYEPLTVLDNDSNFFDDQLAVHDESNDLSFDRINSLHSFASDRCLERNR